MATFYLEYTLTPHASYPTQLCQAASAIMYVHQTLNRPLSEIILAGDSAGGNMVITMLLHLTRPTPSITPQLPGPEAGPLKAAAITAPWVSFNTDQPSVKANLKKDLFPLQIAHTWSGAYLAGKPSTPYAEPLTAPDSWWNDTRVENVIVVAGSDELLLDQVRDWFGRFEVRLSLSLSSFPIPLFALSHKSCLVPFLTEDINRIQQSLHENLPIQYILAVHITKKERLTSNSFYLDKQKGNAKIDPKLIVAPKETHIAAIKNPDLFEYRETLQERGIREFLAVRLLRPS